MSNFSSLFGARVSGADGERDGNGGQRRHLHLRGGPPRGIQGKGLSTPLISFTFSLSKELTTYDLYKIKQQCTW